MDNGQDIRLYQAWREFVNTGIIDAGVVRPVIAESWKRCRARGINPYKLRTSDQLSPQDLAERLACKSALIAIARPYIRELQGFFRGTGFLTALCDEQGYLLYLEGDEDMLHYAAVLGDTPGAYWGEERIGTGAISTCLVTGEPLQVIGAEHWFADHQSWACSGAPIRDPDGNITGALGVSGPFTACHKHTLGMAVLAAKSIELCLRWQEQHPDLTPPA